MTGHCRFAVIPATLLSRTKLFAAEPKMPHHGPCETGVRRLSVQSPHQSKRSKGMKFVRPRLLTIFLIGGASLAVAQEPTLVGHPEQLGFSTARLQRLTQAYQGYVDRGELPGAVLLIAVGDKIAYLQAVGFQDREKKIPMKTDAIFRLASMTKPIVSVAAMMLVEEGKLDLDAPVAQYLPELKDMQVATENKNAETGATELAYAPQKRPMIVRDLLRHTSGLVYPPQYLESPIHRLYRKAVFARDKTLADFVASLAQLPLAHQPGEVWEYSWGVD